MWLSLGSYRYLARRLYDLCVHFMTGGLKAQRKVVLEKPGIEPATTGLQAIALIHHTRAASLP